ncbi:MAG: valine--tRNA ligase [Pseudomonadota bacterium]
MTMDKTFDISAEGEIYRAWEAGGAFAAGANAREGAEPFCIMIPPPNVTGALHVGHAFNNTLQDILTRWHRMRGFDTLWQPGTDHAGIATQMVVERELAKTNRRRQDMSRDEFVGLVWEQKVRSRDNISGQLKRLGASCDWSREAFTMTGAPGDPDGQGPNFHDAVLKVFVDWYEKGLIYRGKRLVNWDPHFETAISDLEVENVEVDGHMWHFKYPLAGGETYEYVEKDEDGAVILRETRDYISIATTRPETMLGDGAVAVHPSDARYAPIVGKLCEIPVGPKEHRRLIPIITDEYPDPDFGSGAVKITGAHDFNDYAVAKRGGIPMYRLMDTKGAMRADGQPYAECTARAQAIAEGAEFTEAEVDTLNLVPDDLRGLDRFEARKRVVAQITEEGLAVMVPADDPRVGGSGGTTRAAPAPEPGPPSPEGEVPDNPPGADFRDGAEGEGAAQALVPLVEAKKIMAPYGDRSKVVIEPMLTDQWFVDTEKVVGPAIEAVKAGRTRILPEQHEKVYFNWLENIEPWCISRQLWWGHQIPVWYGPSYDNDGNLIDIAGESFCATSEQAALAKAKRHYRELLGIEVEVLLQPIEGRAEGMRPEPMPMASGASWGGGPIKPSRVRLSRDPDVLDTWFSSGLWPLGTLGWPEETEALARYYPTSVLITGFDIIFFWVARMMMMQLEVDGREPFHTVYVHALVRDEKGKKMSKSLGNVLDPLELVEVYGADAVRFTLTSLAAMGRDVKLSTKRIEGYRNFGTKLWNAARLAELNGCKPDPAFDPAQVEQRLNRWIVGETARALAAVDAALTAYRFNDAANALYAHVWGVVCDWYLEFAKPLLADGNPAQAETRATVAWVIDQCLILLHPIMPFITEALWGQITARERMLIVTDWPSYRAEALADQAADAEIDWVIRLIEEVRSVRTQMGVAPGARLTLLVTETSETARGRLTRSEALIQRLAMLERIDLVETPPPGAVALPLDGATAHLPIADVIDIGQERARLEKARAKVEKEIGGLGAKLANPKFIANAPEDVVAENRDRLAAAEGEAAKLAAALDRLAAIA